MKKTLLAVSLLLPSVGAAAVSSLAATGWSADIVTNSPAPFNTSISFSLDNGTTVEGYTIPFAGTYPIWNGTSVSSVAVDGLGAGVQTGPSGTFQFQSPSGPNAIVLRTLNSTGTLTLASSVSLSTLAIYGTTAGAGSDTAVSVSVHFTDGSSSLYSIGGNSGITQDWFNPNLDKAGTTSAVYDRVSNRSEVHDGTAYGSLFHDNRNFSIYESAITLSAADQAKLIDTVTFTKTGNNGSRLAIMAISGQAVPETSSAALVALCGALGLVRRRR